ncbi:MAG: hypothetical protein ACREXY_02525 [Gammaproteobacteria bacterium]
MANDFDIGVLRGAAAQGRVQWPQHALEVSGARGFPRRGRVRYHER